MYTAPDRCIILALVSGAHGSTDVQIGLLCQYLYGSITRCSPALGPLSFKILSCSLQIRVKGKEFLAWPAQGTLGSLKEPLGALRTLLEHHGTCWSPKELKRDASHLNRLLFSCWGPEEPFGAVGNLLEP